jgi:hypothetical protein
MTPLPDRAVLSARIARIEELTHELSNTVGMTMNELVCAGTDDLERAYDHLGTATQLAMRSTGTLQVLMWELRLFQELVAGDSVTGKDELHGRYVGTR